MQHTSKTSGFTIVELIVAITVATIVTVSLFAVLVGLWNSTYGNINSTRQANQTQAVMSSIQEDLQNTNRYLITSSIPDTKPGGGNWDFRGASPMSSESRVLILETRATNKYKTDTTRNLVFRQAGGCPLGNTIVYNNIVYFLKGSTLLRRTIVEPSGSYCSGQSIRQLRTCTTPGTPISCQQNDVVVAENVASFSILYYTNPSDITPLSTAYNSSSTQSTIDSIATITVSIKIAGSSNGGEGDFATQVRTSRATAL